MTYHATYAFQSESTLYTCLNVRKLLARNRRNIRSLNDCNEIQTNNHFICKWTLNHLVNWFSVCLQTKRLWVQIPLQLLKNLQLQTNLSEVLHRSKNFVRTVYLLCKRHVKVQLKYTVSIKEKAEKGSFNCKIDC